MLEDILAAEYRDLPPERIEQILGGVSPEDLENFWGTVKNIGGAVSAFFQNGGRHFGGGAVANLYVQTAFLFKLFN